MIITLDGPSGSGKSTLAQKLAERLGCFYLNSGFLYRGLGYVLVTKYGYDEDKLRNPDLKDVEDCLLSRKFVYKYENNRATLSFDGDITPHLKRVEVSGYASLIARHLGAREILKKYQRNLALAESKAVVEGRDCGSSVFVDADMKFFVTASFEVRATRLKNDQKVFGKDLSYEEAYDFVVSRDKRDRKREHAPLIEPEGAIVIDTSEASIEESLKKMITLLLYFFILQKNAISEILQLELKNL